MLARAVTAGALLALALTAAAARASGPELEAQVRAEVAERLAQLHYRPNLVDADALAAQARHRAEEAGSTAGLDEWLAGELLHAFLAFAPDSARPDPATRYGLPFDPVFPRFLAQGAGGRYSHTGREHYAFDFVMPVGTPVRAAREGVVGRVVDGFTEGGADPKLARFSNAVIVLHGDGTFASYAHLSPGIPVREGERVSRGQVLASSGQTGWAGIPHLHFSVERKDHGGGGAGTIPILFGPPKSRGFVPEQGQWVGAPPRPTLDLVVYVDGEAVLPGSTRTARTGQRSRIRVEARSPGGALRDVTTHPDLQLVSMTPWNVDVAGPGELVFRAMEEFPPDWGTGVDQDLAAVGVFCLNNAQREVGLGKIEYRLTDKKGE